MPQRGIEEQGLDRETIDNLSAAQRMPGLSPADLKLTNFDRLWIDRVADHGDRPYLTFIDDDAGIERRYNYAEFNAKINRAANILQNNLGVRRGDRVGTMMVADDDTVALYFACWKIGAAVAPVNVSEDDNRIAFTFENAEVKVVAVLASYLPRLQSLRNRIPTLNHILVMGGGAAGDHLHDYNFLAKNASDIFVPAEKAEPEDEALLIYTSGTTGNPKGVVMGQRNLMVDPDAIARWHGVDGGTTMMCVLPIHHVNGIVVTLLTPFWAGGSTVLNRRFTSRGFWEKVAREKVQIVSVVPTLLQFLYEAQADLSQLDLSGFRHFICGAGTLAVSVAKNFEERFGFRVIHGYGLSETTCYDCFLPVDLSDAEHAHWMRDHGYPSIGCPVHANEMAIHDEQGRALEPGERGEIVVRGPLVMKYYHKRPDANRETFKHGWFRSGDEGFHLIDEKGRRFFFITGRIKELIIRGGVNLSPFEIEEILNEMPGVKTGLAVAFLNDYYSEEVGAYVVVEEGATLSEDDIIRYCMERLPWPKVPKVIKFGTEVPVTSTGKYQRLKLKSLFDGYSSVQFKKPK